MSTPAVDVPHADLKVARKRHATLAPGRVSRLSMWLHSKSRWEEAALAARIVQPHFCDGRRTSLALQSKLGVITREDYSWWTPPSGFVNERKNFTTPLTTLVNERKYRAASSVQGATPSPI